MVISERVQQAILVRHVHPPEFYRVQPDALARAANELVLDVLQVAPVVNRLAVNAFDTQMG